MAKAKMAAAVAHAPEAADEKLVSPEDQDRVSALAHEFWMQRGYPLGSPEVDWLRAEEEMRASTASGILDQ